MKKRVIILSALLATASIWIGMKYWSKPSFPTMPAVTVQASKVVSTSLPLEAKAIGNLVAARSVEITPEVAGHLRKILFKDGISVTKNTVLFELNDDVYKTKSELAKAKLAYSEMNYERTSLLAKKGVLAKQSLEQADADLKERRADAEESTVMLGKMRLLAPFDGQLGKRKVNRGEYVTVGQSLVTLTDVKHLNVEYHLPENLLASLKLGQAITISTSAYPKQKFQGKVAFVSPTVNTDNRSILVYAKVPNEEGLLAPGMFVNVTHFLGTDSKALMIPARCLVPMLDGEQVYKVVDGKAYAVTVLVGKRTKDQVQILQGLSLGDIVITDGQLKIKNGVPVKIKT